MFNWVYVTSRSHLTAGLAVATLIYLYWLILLLKYFIFIKVLQIAILILKCIFVNRTDWDKAKMEWNYYLYIKHSHYYR